MLAVLGVLALQPMLVLAIIPQPASVVMRPGEYFLTPRSHIVVDDATRDVGEMLRSQLAPATAYRLDFARRGSLGDIRLTLDPKLANLGPEGYRLTVKPSGVEIRASKSAGLFYGVQSFRQMLPTQIFRRAQVFGMRWSAPCAVIEDQPRFAWRGMHLDVCRHFMPKEFVLKFIDLIALHKFNTFHWHLTDDQGWRIEIKRYPKLTEVGAWRKDSMITYDPPTFTGKPHGGFYTQDDIREVVDYAKDRFVTVVPEIEMPGHSQAAIAAYPELGSGKQVEVGTRWGVINDVFNTEDSTIQFLQNVLEEVIGLFPSTFIHIGGDEVPKVQWHDSLATQAKMRQLGLKDEHEMQSWFIRQMDTWLTAHNRRLIGWDEILEGGLAPGAAVMSWRGIDGGIAAAKAGHDVVMAPGTPTYFDRYQSQDTKREPLAIGGFLPLDKVYAYEPIPSKLTAEEAKHVLGAQGQLWTEYIPGHRQVEYMAFPRACALSEVLWSPKDSHNYDNFLDRLPIHLQRLNALDVNYRPLEGPKQ